MKEKINFQDKMGKNTIKVQLHLNHCKDKSISVNIKM
jgi:hypothetical protein